MCFRPVVWILFLSVLTTIPKAYGQDFLKWSAKQASDIGKMLVAKGKVKGEGWRVYSTHKSTSFNYRATWLTPAVIQASARLHQLNGRLSDQETLQLVEEAERAGQTVFLIELDAIEGAGVIPSDWQAFLQPAGLASDAGGSAIGQNSPELWKMKGLGGTLERDYKYDRFWMVFPLVNKDGHVLFHEDTEKAELIIRILGKEAKIQFRIPDDVREKAKRQAAGHSALQGF